MGNEIDDTSKDNVSGEYFEGIMTEYNSQDDIIGDWQDIQVWGT